MDGPCSRETSFTRANSPGNTGNSTVADYEHDVFVSYRRADDAWVRWTRDNFARPLCSLLRPALGEVHTFIDENLEAGVTWPPR